MQSLCDQLVEWAPALEENHGWPDRQLQLCAEYGVHGWFLPPAVGGLGWNEVDVYRGYMQLAASCLTTTFVLTQRVGACRRIAGSDNEAVKQRLLPPLLDGSLFATVGISHLTTSRRHLKEPVLRAESTSDGFRLTGFSPWVTGSPYADWYVVGATLPDRREILLAVPRDAKGLHVPDTARLTALTASQTGPVQFDAVDVARDFLLSGPVEDVMQQGSGAGTGGLQTSALAIGLTEAAIRFLGQEADRRADLETPSDKLQSEWQGLRQSLLEVAAGNPVCSKDQIRTAANSLVLRATQAALTAAKGTGYVQGHPAGRWCREALFFLVWSCPQPVLAANLCELAGIQS